jgi:hypothetical protein
MKSRHSDGWLRLAAPCLAAMLLLGAMPAGAEPAGSAQSRVLDLDRPLEFRAMFAWESGDAKAIEPLVDQWSREGYNAVIWGLPMELWVGQHALVRHEKFPEARELSPEDNEKRIAEAKALFRLAKQCGMKNLLYTQEILFTKAFAKAHGLDKPMPVSPSVNDLHNVGYGGDKTATNLGVRTELTVAYIDAVFSELLKIYDDLDGFFSPIGEPLPGDRGTFFREAMAPAMKRSGRHPLMIAHQWQVPLDTYVKNVAAKDVYDNTWLNYHAWNSEQITDAKPYPGLIEYVEKTGLPSLTTVYPANIQCFPFNSPRFAWEITQEMKKIPNFRGFMYWEHSGRLLSPLFRKALAHYAMTGEPYSDEPWLKLLEEQFGDRTAAERFLNAYDLSARIYPEISALVYNGSDYFRKELRIPYSHMTDDVLGTRLTSPARGGSLVSIKDYAKYAARHPGEYKNRSGADATRPPYTQSAIWASEGGSRFDTLPLDHMHRVRELGEQALKEAKEAVKTVKKNPEEAQRAIDFMQGYRLMARYAESKVAAAAAALMFAEAHRPEDRAEAERLADETLAAYLETVSFLKVQLEPVLARVYQRGYNQNGRDLAGLIQDEKNERHDLAKIFKWPAP